MTSFIGQSIRSLRRTPTFSVMAIITAAIGIGATVAMFTAFNAILLRPLPYADADRLVRIRVDEPGINLSGLLLSVPEFRHFASQAKSLSNAGAWTSGTMLLTDDGETTALRAISATPSLLATLGLRAIAGRTLGASDGIVGAEPVTLISEELWRTRFGGEAAAVGRSITVGGVRRRIVGVLPAGVKFPPVLGSRIGDVWVPLAFTPAEETVWGRRNYGMIAKLAPGSSLAALNDDLKRIGASFSSEAPMIYTQAVQWRPTVTPIRVEAQGNLRTMLPIMMGAVSLVLVVSSANLASLLLLRAGSKRRESAVRLALGGGSARIATQFVGESVTIALLGGGFGIAMAAASVGAIRAAGVPELAWLADLRLDWRVAVFAMFVTVLVGVLCGLAPAASLRGLALHDALRSEGRGIRGGGRRERRAQSSLIGLETALAVVLLTGAGLMIRTMSALNAVDPGFDPERAFTAAVAVPTSRFPDSSSARTAMQQIIARVGASRGIESVSGVSELPLTGGSVDWSYRLDGGDALAQADRDDQVRIVAPGYFETMRIRLVAGRYPGERDDIRAPRVVVVNEAFAKAAWPASDAVGKRMDFDGSRETPNWATVIGVVGNVREDGLDAAARPVYYVPFLQSPGRFQVRSLQLVVRASGASSAVSAAVRRAIIEADPGQPSVPVTPLGTIVESTMAIRRLITLLLGAFSAATLTIAMVGLFALMAAAVEQRRAEIGVRMALGAKPSEVLRLFVAEGLAVVAIGGIVGLALSRVLGAVLQSQLYGVRATDSLNAVAAFAALCVAALAACLIPAQRAARTDPIVAMRSE